ncbi:hypothetical protein COW53_04595 [bacterium CG17_big_fil_post_rev_8_21_14_2_50_64_8]|nr:MAG: hypothetical protein COW53_04595 [bacterium CG17_big_fil_post_rev_8_21_14_2_50_64_8]PJA75579.1 MAG: hypothetical protein CO151_05120 [bacterium CG_4_9_14_3_um_filter_65_15]
MLISKKSPRKSELFQSRFSGPNSADFALRQYHRCREEYSASLLQVALTGVFGILLVMFGRAVWHLFARHGADLNPWYRYLATGMVVAMILTVLRRLLLKVLEIRNLRREIADFRNVLQLAKEAEYLDD